MAKARIIPAAVFRPGEYLRDELAARGWTQGDFAKIIGRPMQVVNEIINGRKRITVATANAIGLALGTGPELWLNLENTYRLHTTAAADPAIARRAAVMA